MRVKERKPFIYAPQAIARKNHAFCKRYLEKSEGSKRGEPCSKLARKIRANCLRLIGAPRYFIHL